jgi:hypothetical protein
LFAFEALIEYDQSGIHDNAQNQKDNETDCDPDHTADVGDTNAFEPAMDS